MAQTLLSTSLHADRRETVELGPIAPTIRIMGIDFAAVTEDEVIAAFVDRAVLGVGYWVVTANLDHLRRFASEPEPRELIGQADLVVADGAPIVIASRIAGMPLPERVAGSNMVLPISRRAAERGASMFLLGGEPGVALRARAMLEEAVPGLSIVGTCCPPRGFEENPAMIDEVECALRDARPDIVLLALGFPKQDSLVRRLREILPGTSFMGIGIALSYVVGDQRRAPAWMRAASIEWLHRLISEPRRLWRRYLLLGMPFAARLVCAAALTRVRRSWWTVVSSDRRDEETLGSARI